MSDTELLQGLLAHLASLGISATHVEGAWTIELPDSPTLGDVNTALRAQNQDLVVACKSLQQASIETSKAYASHLQALTQVLRVLAAPAEDDRDELDEGYAKHPNFVRTPAVRGLLGGTHGFWSDGKPALWLEHAGAKCLYGDHCGPLSLLSVSPGLRLRVACEEHRSRLIAGLRTELAEERKSIPHNVVGSAAALLEE